MKQSEIILEVSIIVSKKDGLPCIELRRRSSQTDTIKALIYAALKGRPIQVYPVLRNRLSSISSMVEKGILYYDAEKEIYEFNL